MATQKTKFASEATVKAVASESKNYAKKVSAITVTVDTTTDVKATIYNFTQNGAKIGSIKVDKENFVDEVTVVEIAKDTVINPSNPGTEDSPNYLEEGKYLKITFKDANKSTIYVKTSEIGADMSMEEITAEEVADMFKEDISLTFDAAAITVEAKGAELTSSDKVKEGWVLTISAPTTNPADSSTPLTSITVNGVAVTPLADSEDNTKKVASYTATTANEKDGIAIAAVYG